MDQMGKLDRAGSDSLSTQRRALELFARLLEHPAPPAVERIRAWSGSDATLAAELTAIWQAHLEATESGSSGGGLSTAELTAVSHTVPERIGEFRVLSELQSGGMSRIYVARQESPARDVALKVLPPGKTNEKLRRRFELEAEFLARLTHPFIAHIYQYGVHQTPLGDQPYIAMELVRGERVDVYCRRRALPLEERIALCADICEGVHAAHQRGVLHRDLKPPNILLCEERSEREAKQNAAASGVAHCDVFGNIQRLASSAAASPASRRFPKILDFGVACNHEAEAARNLTAAGELLGTFAYMSPEQALNQPERVETTTDIYSLGVLIYELATDRLPYELPVGCLSEIIQTIAEAPPAALGLGRSRRLAELEVVLNKALAKNPRARYASAWELAADLRRWLAHEPVAARPLGFMDHVRRQARRHRTSVALAAVLLLLGAAGTGWGLLTAYAQRDRALQEAHNADQAAEFMFTMLDQIDLEQFGRQIAGQIHREAKRGRLPELVNALADDVADDETDTLSDELGQLNMSEVARSVLRDGVLNHAYTTLMHQHQVGSPVAWRLYESLGRMHQKIGEFRRAEDLLTRALSEARRLKGPESPATARTMFFLGRLLKSDGRFAESERLHRNALRIQKLNYGEYHAHVAESLASLGACLHDQSRFSEAEAFYRRALVGFRQCYGREHRSIARMCNNLGLVLRSQGKDLFLSERLMQEALRIWSRDQTRNKHEIAMAHNNLGLVREDLGDVGGALEQMQRGLDMRCRTMGHFNPLVAQSLYNIGGVHLDCGELEIAEAYFRRALTILEREVSPAHGSFVRVRIGLAQIMMRRELFDAAEHFLCAARSDLLFEPQHSLMIEAKLSATTVVLYDAWNAVEPSALNVALAAEARAALAAEPLASVCANTPRVPEYREIWELMPAPRQASRR